MVMILEAISASKLGTHRGAVAGVASSSLCVPHTSICLCVCLSSRGSTTCTTASPSLSTTWVTVFLWLPSWLPSCFSWPCGEFPNPPHGLLLFPAPSPIAPPSPLPDSLASTWQGGAGP